MNDEINWDEIRLTWPYEDKTCDCCVWALPTADLGNENKRCRYFNKEVERQPACNYFVHWVVGHLL